MISDNHFYKHFQINYFDYKISCLRFLIDNINEMNFKKDITGYSESDFKRALQSDLRQTRFQAIETVFEVMFALKSKSTDRIKVPLIEVITNYKFSYEEIKRIASSEDALSFLDAKITLGDKSKTTLGKFIFYPGIKKDEFQKEIEMSMKVIKKGLQVLAKEFSDRREYNSYKHGLRILPAYKEISFHDPTAPDSSLSFNLENTMTFYSKGKKGDFQYITKSFDTEKDFRTIKFSSVLLWNMIKLRDFAINGTSPDGPSNGYLLSMEAIDEIKRTDVKIQDFIYSVKRGE